MSDHDRPTGALGSGNLPDDDDIPVVDPKKVALAKEGLRYLDKMVKTMALFGPGHNNVERARDEFKETIAKFLDEHGELALDLEGSRIFYQGTQIADSKAAGGEGQEDFTFRLFQDGVVELKLMPGIDGDEIDGMLEILLANFTTGPYCHDDTVTLFWERGPKRYRFLVAPEYDDMGSNQGGGGGAEGTEAYRDIRIGLLDRRAEPGQLGQVEDQQAQIAQLEGFAREGRLAPTADERGQLKGEAQAGEPTLVGKYVEVLLRVIAYGEDEAKSERAVTVIKQLFLSLAEGAGVEQACRLLERLRAVVSSKDNAADAQIREAVEAVLSQIGDKELVLRIIRGLAPKTAGEVIDEMRVRWVLHFLSLLGVPAIPHILDHLDLVPNPQIREQVATLLARMGPDQVEEFRGRLAQPGSKIVGELMHILAVIGTPASIEAMLEAAGHPEVEVRLKVMKHLGDLRTERVVVALLERLGDKDDKVRKMALDKLGNMEGELAEKVTRKMRDLIRDKDFQYREKEEKRRMFAVLGKLGGEQQLPFFRECFETKNTLKRAAIDELRACGAYMLGVLKDTRSRDALAKGAKARLASSFFKTACTQAVAMIDGKIDPGRGPAGEPR